jgi:asparagine synthase (glutamine-hydrolysing)
MCGIAGFLQIDWLSRDASSANLSRMASVLAHRGPDDGGTWLDPSGGIALCHRRLSIIDLSPLGHQPMVSASGRLVITFNGEIYNYRQLRAELLACGHAFRGGSDTEVLLAAFEQWGVESALVRCRGMFAFALWDRQKRELHLARDRFGEKPLYYGIFRGCLVFGSELKALRQHDAWRADIDRDALTLLLRHNFIPAPHSIFRQVRKVRPGTVLTVRKDGSSLSTSERAYWSPSPVAEEGAEPARREAPADQVSRVHEALQEAVRLQMVADVPVGAFLSGGIDSSLVVALMQRAGNRPVKTFTVGFAEREFDEAPFARQIAQHLGTDHTELTVTEQDALRVIPSLPRMYDEPFADSSQIPTFLIAKLARQEVTVALSGDAGDELFGGYARYQQALARWQRLRRVPGGLRRASGYLLERVPRRALEAAAQPLALALRSRGRAETADRLLERARMCAANSLPELYHSMTSFWQPPERFIIGGHEPETVANRRTAWPRGMDDLAHMMYVDSCLYLPDDVLVKVDRAAMAVSLETRVPLLDARVAEAAWRIPSSVHARDGRGKWVLRQLLEQYMPRQLFERPKKGFGVPIARWLRGELKDWAGDLLDTARLRREGFFEPLLIERRWQQHLAGAADWSSHLWDILMFQAWLADAHGELASSSRTRHGAERPCSGQEVALT